MLAAMDLAYRLVYGQFLSRLPESLAVSVGQWALRRLPLDRVPLFRVADPALAISLGGVRLPNPLILSSMYYDPLILWRAMGLGFGAVTTKSITAGPRPGHPEPNLVRHSSPAGPGLVNCNGFQNPGLAAYRRALSGLPHRIPLIVAAAGESIDEYAEVVAGLGPLGDLVEINISSPNTRIVYEWARKPAELGRLFAAVAQATSRPLIVKVSPDHRDHNEAEVIPAALEAGIRIVNAGNTRRIDDAAPVAGGRWALRSRDLPGHARERPAAARPLRRSDRDHRHRRHRLGGEGDRRPRGRRHRVRLLHRLHHARADARPPHPRRAAAPSLKPAVHLSTRIHKTQIARADAAPRGPARENTGRA